VVLIGRKRERARIDALLDGARGGIAGTLLLRGPAGTGKTALLEHAIEGARDLRVVRCAGIESEAELQFSGLLELCRPLLQDVGGAAAVHVEVIEGALGLRDTQAPEDRFAIGLATLVLLARCAEESPLLVVCDDLQWLDRSSVDALLFAVRRLEVDAVATILASRPSESELGGRQISTIDLEGLDEEETATLLTEGGMREVAPEVAAWLATETGGNPLALTELRRLLTPQQLAGRERLDAEVVPGTTVELTFARQVESLPVSCRQALLLAALSLHRELRPIVAAMEAEGLAVATLEPAEEVGLISVEGGRIAFRHPLVRSAVVHGATPAARRSAHRVLAGAMGQGEQASAAWHRSASVVAPDESVAAELEAAAGAAARRGGFAEAAAALTRAAELTPDQSVGLGRMLRGAEAAWQAGRAEQARALVQAPLELSSDPETRGRALRLQGALLYVAGATAEGATAFLEAAALLSEADPETAVAIGADAVNGHLPYANPAAVLDAADDVVRLAFGRGTKVEAIGDVTRGHALCFAGRIGEGRVLLGKGLAALDGAHDLRSLGPARLAYAFAWLGRENEGRQALALAVEGVRARGAIGWLPYVLATVGWHDVRLGQWRAARAAATEAIQLATEVGQPVAELQARMVLMWLAALRGDREGLEVESQLVSRSSSEYGFTLYALLVPLSLGVLLMSEGRVAEAIEPLEEAAFDARDYGFHIPGFTPTTELAEAYARSGRPVEAESLLDSLEQLEISELPLEQVAIARCRGLLAPDADYEALFGAARAVHDRITAPLEAARMSLCLGERLRRAGRRVDSRAHLRTALLGFEALGAAAWAERARAELRASGETLRREVVAGEELTPQELQIALQVVDGRTNREVGAALFLSPKTVEFHLGRVFRKLSIGSRRELAGVFASSRDLTAGDRLAS
jgi:DNA-binding CsgD family transcriptional regulator